MTHITLSQAFTDGSMLKRVFSWLSRIGAAPKFGSRPISWYQIHQAHCVDILLELGIEEPCCRDGIITDRVRASKSISAFELFNQADNRSRK